MLPGVWVGRVEGPKKVGDRKFPRDERMTMGLVSCSSIPQTLTCKDVICKNPNAQHACCANLCEKETLPQSEIPGKPTRNTHSPAAWHLPESSLLLRS